MVPNQYMSWLKYVGACLIGDGLEGRGAEGRLRLPGRRRAGALCLLLPRRLRFLRAYHTAMSLARVLS